MPIALEDVCFRGVTAQARACMVGFRNVAVHVYQSLNLGIVRSIVEEDWVVFVEFARQLCLLVEVRR